jgi:hypothetical protein
MKTQWIMHKGKKILYIDCSNLSFNVATTKAELGGAISLAANEPLDSVLTLTNMTDTKVSPEMYNLLRDTASQIAPRVHKRAIVGVTGIQRSMLDLINKIAGNKTFTIFDDLEAAKNWLITG